MESSMRIKRILAAFALTFVCPVGFAADGETGPVNITTIWTDAVNYGGCMVRIDPAPSTFDNYQGGAMNCPASDAWVSFDCLNSSGLTSKAAANAMFSSAQLAFVSGQQVNVVFSDAPKINGWCRVVRLDVLPAAP